MNKFFVAILGFAMVSTPAWARELNGREVIPQVKFVWSDTVVEDGPLTIRVNLATQMAYVYRNDTVIAETSISTGRDGYETPTGTFPIWAKELNHHSKHYDADMPYTEWLTHDGVALHAGGDPGRPSSHGCVHLPYAFARDLFAMTQIGDVVEIVNEAPALDLAMLR